MSSHAIVEDILKREAGAPLLDLGRENWQLKRLLRLRSQIVTASTHETRGALVAINGYSKLLLEEEPGPIDQAQRQYLKTILENARKLNGLLENLVKEVWNEDLILEECDFLDLWREAARAHYSRIARKSIRFRMLLPERRLPIAADPRKLGFALRSLLGGAIRAASQDGEILAAISVPDDHITASISGNRASGIPAFSENPVCRESDGARRPRPSRGYSFVEKIVHLHGGWLSTQRVPGEHFTVTFTLPLL